MRKNGIVRFAVSGRLTPIAPRVVACALASALVFSLASPALPKSSPADSREADLKSVHDDVTKQIRERESEYDKEQSRLKETRKGAASLARRERRLIKTLEESDRALSKTREALTLQIRQLEILNAEIQSTQNLRSTEQLLEDRRRVLLASRVRAMYVSALMSGRVREIGAYGDGLLAERNDAGMVRLASADRNRIGEIVARKNGFERVEIMLGDKTRKIAAAHEQKRALEKKQSREQSRRRVLLDDVRSRKSGMEEQARQLEESAANIKLLLTTLRERSSRLKEQLSYLKKEFEDRRGLLRWPVAGREIVLVRPYGRIFDESIRTWRVNKGIDILTESNQSVYAVSKGEVVFADFFGRMGNLVIVAHGGDYFTLYAHLSEIGVRLSDKLESGALLGRTGNTGLLDERPVLHFEVREGSHAVDPELWLGRR